MHLFYYLGTVNFNNKYTKMYLVNRHGLQIHFCISIILFFIRPVVSVSAPHIQLAG